VATPLSVPLRKYDGRGKPISALVSRYRCVVTPMMAAERNMRLMFGYEF